MAMMENLLETLRYRVKDAEANGRQWTVGDCDYVKNAIHVIEIRQAMVDAALEAERRYNDWIMSMMDRHLHPEKEAPALAQFQYAMTRLSIARYKMNEVKK